MLKTFVLLLAAQANGGLITTDPPSDAEVLRAMPKVARGVPILFEHFRDDMTIVKNRLASTAFAVPLPAGASLTLSKQSWECAVYYTETVQSLYPIPVSTKKTQRAAWTVGDRKEPIYEAGIANLTQAETPLMVHFGKDRSQQWTLIRIDPPAEKK